MQEADVTVATFDSKTQALMTVDTLKAEGVPSAYVPLDPDDTVSGSPVQRSGPTLPYEVRVRSVDAERAKSILVDFGIRPTT